MNPGQLLITVDEKNAIQVQLKGPELLHVSLLGACEFAKDFLMRRIKTTSPLTENWNPSPCTKPQNTDNNKASNESVTKKQALDFYLEHLNKVKARIDAISKSAEQAEFQLNNNLNELF